MDTNTKIGIVLGVLVIVLIPLMVVWGTNKKIEAERTAENRKQWQIDICLDEAHKTYAIDWNRACKRLGLADDCSLYPVTYNLIEERYNTAKEDCLTRYK